MVNDFIEFETVVSWFWSWRC